MASVSAAPRVRALDGIRAFAVLAVLASHTPGTGMPGGYLGVDAFFALSGYLITSLLLREHEQSATISLGSFWARRARRLLPALFVLLTVIGIAAALWPGQFASPGLRADALSAVFYVANWHLIAQHTNYFVATGMPSPLTHTWSLAIEEQFYLLWPLLVLAVLGWRRSRPSRRAFGRVDPLRPRSRLHVLLVLSVAGALTSAIWMALITPNVNDTVRSYYGSDTRAQSLLVGAALAAAFALWGPIRSPRTKAVVSILGLVAAFATLAMWVFVPDSSFFAFHGGFLLAATATCMIIACAVGAPRSPLPSFLSLGPPRYLGSISYGMYLWYLPVVLVISPARAHATGYELYAMRLAVDVALAALSAHLIEIPIRRAAYTWRWSLAAPVAASLAMLSVFAATLAPANAGALPATATAHLAVSGREDAPAPVKVLLLGDSMAGSLGVGLSEMAPGYDAEVVNEGNPGCSLSMDDEIRALLYAAVPGPPCQPGDPQALLDTWKRWVDAWNPDVVLYIARGEVLDQVIGSSPSWVHIGEPTFDSRLEARYQQALRILGSRGARVYLLGSPLYHSGAEPLGDSSPWQEDDPARVDEDDTLMEAAVLHDPAESAYIDVGAWVTPDGRYRSEQDGVELRCADGVHFTAAAGRLVAEKLFPLVMAAGRAHQSSAPGGAWPGGPPPPATPPWYGNLQC